MESVRRATAKSTQNTEEQKKIDPYERLIELLNPTLGKLYRTFYKQHIKLVMKLAYIKQHESKHSDILCKSNETDNK